MHKWRSAFFSFFLFLLSKWVPFFWARVIAEFWLCSVRAEQTFSPVHWAERRCPFSALISIPPWLRPEKVRSLFRKSQATAQCCYFSPESDICLDVFSAPTLYLLVFLHSLWCVRLCASVRHGGYLHVSVIPPNGTRRNTYFNQWPSFVIPAS